MSENAEIERKGRAALTLAGGLLLLAVAGGGRPSAAYELQAVGLEARGVDPRAALRGDLDVRDALNRPVSRVLVEQQIAGASAATDRSAQVSRLPLAETVWRLLSRVLWGLVLRGGLPGPLGASETPWRLPAPKSAMPALALAALASACISIWPLRAKAVPAYAITRPLVLRC